MQLSAFQSFTTCDTRLSYACGLFHLTARKGLLCPCPREETGGSISMFTKALKIEMTRWGLNLSPSGSTAGHCFLEEAEFGERDLTCSRGHSAQRAWHPRPHSCFNLFSAKSHSARQPGKDVRTGQRDVKAPASPCVAGRSPRTSFPAFIPPSAAAVEQGWEY